MSIIKQNFGEINEAWDFPDISDGTDLTIYSSRFNKGTDGYARYKDIGNKRYIEIKGRFTPNFFEDEIEYIVMDNIRNDDFNWRK